MTETSTKPYLIRALHEWCTDNGYTPYIAVAVDSRTVVPREHVRDGQITLNVGTLATHKLVLGNEVIEFQARFGGVSRHISIPVDAVLAIYARETGQGMAFEVVTEAEHAMEDSENAEHVDTPGSSETHEDTTERPTLTAVPGSAGSERDEDPDNDPPPASPDPSSRPRLKVIK